MGGSLSATPNSYHKGLLMHSQQRAQTRALFQQHGIDQAVFAKPHTITWLTGFAPPVQVGPNLFTASYPVVWYDDGLFTLVVVDAYGDLAAPFDAEPDGRVVTYPGYRIDAPIASAQGLLEVFTPLADVAHAARIGIEREYVSHLLAAEFDRAKVAVIDGWLEPLRMVKTDEEIAKLRRSFALTDIAHAAARAAAVPGTREIDVWNAVHTAIQAAAGQRVPVGNDCVVGTRQANIGGWPEDRVLSPGGSLIVDISVVLGGYWSDSCATYYAGERSPQQSSMHQAVANALDLALSLLRPGAVARDIDQQVRHSIAAAGYAVYPHHTGHGLGVSGHEGPRITPYNDEVLQAGMVIAVEPGTYIPGETGVRLEHAALITSDGAELLTQHDVS
jgi:Xaa-Pro dipeptidase